MENYKIGDVVRAGTNSPKLTVTEVKENIIECMWFVKNEIKKSFFNAQTLTIVKSYQETQKDLSIADRVNLKSGGPDTEMIVEEIKENIIECMWFVNDIKKRATFHPATIEKFEININITF